MLLTGKCPILPNQMEASNDDVDMMAKAREIIELRFRDASSLDEVRNE